MTKARDAQVEISGSSPRSVLEVESKEMGIRDGYKYYCITETCWWPGRASARL
jgi:hypothetical protein